MLKHDYSGPFSLNIGDNEAGLTFLHHLFSNFDMNSDKAANLFRKMVTLHNRLGGHHPSGPMAQAAHNLNDKSKR